MWVNIVYISIIVQIITSESPFSIDFTCTNQIFDISSLQCASCDSSSNLTASFDQASCLPCDTSTNAMFNISTLQCDCDSENQYLSDLKDRKICTQCPTDYSISEDGYECVLCESPKIIDSLNNYKCVCPSPFISTQSGKGCVSESNSTFIDSNYDLTISKQVRYKNIDTSEITTIQSSDLFEYYFLNSAVNCQIYNDIQSCQILANLCVLTMYNKEHNSCKLFISISNLISTVSNNIQNWKQNLPFLYYPNHNIITSTALSSLSVTLNSKLTLIVVKYSMNGTMLGYEEITNQLFYFCTNNEQTTFTTIGHNIDVSCEYDLSLMFNSKSNTDIIFYDPYILIESDNTYYPIPIYVENIDNDDGYKIVRRFFISDNLSSNNELIMYIKSVLFKVTIYNDNNIYPPLIQIRYGLKQLTDINSNSKIASISFKSYYTKDLTSFKISAIIFFVITLILIVAIWIYKVYKYQRIELSNAINVNSVNSQHSDLIWFIRIIFIGFGVSSNLFLYLLFFISSYCYLSYKGQSNIKFLLPQNDDSTIFAFKAMLMYCFFAKLVHVLMLIWDQCNVDVFFVDWEKPKGNIMAMLQQQQFMFQKQQQQQQQQQHYPIQQQWSSNSMNLNSMSHSSMNMNNANNNNNNNINNWNSNPINNNDIGIISCWRKLFVANEWNELSIYRNINTSITFFVFLLFMIGFEFQYLSLQKPTASVSANDATITPISIVFQFLISTFFLIIIYIIQYLYYFFVNDRFCSSDPYMDLIDLASIANISIFILDSRYHGFYIHGKTIHQHSDTSLEIINKNIESERKNLCKSRGLLPNKDTFEIFVSTQFRQQYDEIYRDVLQYELNKLHQQRRASFNINNNVNQNQTDEGDNILLSKQLIKSSKLLSMFLCDFIEKSCPHIWEVRELIGFERFIGPMPNLSTEKNSIFYEDFLSQFKTKLMYIGLQYDLAILSILTFAFIDNVLLTKNNTIISILITYIIDYILLKIRSYFGERNVSRKTMIDQKFLI